MSVCSGMVVERVQEGAVGVGAVVLERANLHVAAKFLATKDISLAPYPAHPHRRAMVEDAVRVVAADTVAALLCAHPSHQSTPQSTR